MGALGPVLSLSLLSSAGFPLESLGSEVTLKGAVAVLSGALTGRPGNHQGVAHLRVGLA